MGLIRAPRVGRDGLPPGAGSISASAQDTDLLKLLTWNLQGLNLHVIAHAEFIDGDELIAAFQPRARFDGQGDFLTTTRL